MSTFIYQGGLRFVGRSGVGQAIAHQKEALRRVGEEVETRPSPSTRIVHINTVFPDSLLTVLCARMRGWKVVYYAHSTMEDFRGSFPLSNVLAPLFRCYLRLCYNLGDIVVTPTDYSKRIISGYGIRRPIRALSNGVDTSRFRRDEARGLEWRRRWGLGEDDKVVVTAALPIERKGILDFIALARKMEKVRFIWFGSLPKSLIPRAVRRAMAEAPSNVSFPGFVSQEELVAAYSGADCFLFLSREETEGIAVLEALSCGIPAVLRSIPAYGTLERDGLSCCLFSTDEALEEAVERVRSGQVEGLCEKEIAVAAKRDILQVGLALREIHRSLETV